MHSHTYHGVIKVRGGRVVWKGGEGKKEMKIRKFVQRKMILYFRMTWYIKIDLGFYNLHHN